MANVPQRDLIVVRSGGHDLGEVVAVLNRVAWFLRNRWTPVAGAPEFVAQFRRDGRGEDFDLLKWATLLECGASGAGQSSRLYSIESGRVKGYA